MKNIIIIALGLLALAAPIIAPSYQNQLAMLWVMVTLSLTWDIMGGQMGYNSFGNIVFFGFGMYVTAVIQRDMYITVDEFTDVADLQPILNATQYITGLSVGLVVAAISTVILAIILGIGMLGLRGHYFAIATLGLGVAAGEIAAGIDYIGSGSGMVPPLYPDSLGDTKGYVFYYAFLILGVVTFLTLRRVYAGRFGLAINAIRDDEDKAEAMGLHTTKYKTVAWAIAAFFMAILGGLVGNLIGFIDPIEVAFAGSTFGVWMVLMAILGGKGSTWGPVIGAVIFHITQEIFWTYLLGWQRVALGVLIVVIVVFFPEGIMGWLSATWPDHFGEKVGKSLTREGNASS